MLISSSFSCGNNILMSDISNFVHVSFKTSKYGSFYFQKSINRRIKIDKRGKPNIIKYPIRKNKHIKQFRLKYLERL